MLSRAIATLATMQQRWPAGSLRSFGRRRVSPLSRATWTRGMPFTSTNAF
jgi:hypothetical protein